MSEDHAQDQQKRADEARVALAAERWRAHSRRVKRYRRILPVVILALAGGALTWTVFRTVMSGVERKASESREIRLDNPMFHGQDAQGRSFVIGAQGAVRDPTTGQFRLVSPLLRLNLTAQKTTELSADGGLYNEAGREVVIGPNVHISDGGTGWTLVTPEAVVDTETGVVTGDKGVKGRGPLGSIDASSYAIYDQGQRVVFNGQGENKVSGTINPAGSSR